jgi:AraC-like DNA-binding protein
MTVKMLSVFDPCNIGKIPHFIPQADYPYFYVRLPADKRVQPPGEAASQPKRAANNQHKSKMKKAVKYINGRLTHPLSLEEVARHIELSPCYFSKLFKKHQGIGFNLYVNQQRMKQAKLLLDMPELSIATVARNLGFSQTSYFCRLFRQIYQITPQTYRYQNGQSQRVSEQ